MVSPVARLGVPRRRQPWSRPRALAFGLALALADVSAARAQDRNADGTADAGDSTDNGYTPPAGATPPLQINGYIDVGFAKAQGDGTSFAPGDLRLPVHY